MEVQKHQLKDQVDFSVVKLSQKEADTYYHSVNELYDMYVEAAEHVIENELFFDLGIPFNLVDAIKKSWENDVHWHVYGAFLLSGGIDKQPIKLLGFEADTPSGLYDASQEQLEDSQFNDIYASISKNFKRLLTLDDGVENFDERYDGWKILFSSPSDDETKERDSRLLQQMAEDAGFSCSFSYLHEVEFNEDGIHDENGESYEYWCKNYSWLDMATDEGELLTDITNIINNQQAIIINPAYTALFESRGMMKVLQDLYPDSPYLLKTSFEEFEGSIEKTVFGEGPEYSNFKKIYQETQESKRKAKVFFAYEACGLSFSNESETMDNISKFEAHVIS